MHPVAALSLFPKQVLQHVFSPMDFLGIGFLGLMFVVHTLAGWRQKKDGPIGGTGKVVGIVGRMGSGKSYFAVRMAYRRLCAGANVCTNFTMKLTNHCETYEEWFDTFGDEGLAEVEAGHGATNCRRGVKYKIDILDKKEKPKLNKDGTPQREWREHRCPCDKITGHWRQFSGWDDFSTLDNAVVIIDEAHLYAPSNKAMQFPQAARWKMSQARKFRLDVYWITQHENRVNSVLKDLTNFMYVCRAFMNGILFLAKGWEPENMRRKNKHLDRVAYRLDLRIANLYDTLQILDLDDHLATGRERESIELARQVATAYNARKGMGSTTGGGRIAKRAPSAAPGRPRPVAPQRPAEPRQAASAPMVPAPAPEAPTGPVRPATGPCDHERMAKKRAGTCRTCAVPAGVA